MNVLVGDYILTYFALKDQKEKFQELEAKLNVLNGLKVIKAFEETAQEWEGYRSMYRNFLQSHDNVLNLTDDLVNLENELEDGKYFVVVDSDLYELTVNGSDVRVSSKVLEVNCIIWRKNDPEDLRVC